jgi:hypothetical protein
MKQKNNLNFKNSFKNFFLLTKETKNQWARDDPAFVVVQASFVAVKLT